MSGRWRRVLKLVLQFAGLVYWLLLATGVWFSDLPVFAKVAFGLLSAFAAVSLATELIGVDDRWERRLQWSRLPFLVVVFAIFFIGIWRSSDEPERTTPKTWMVKLGDFLLLLPDQVLADDTYVCEGNGRVIGTPLARTSVERGHLRVSTDRDGIVILECIVPLRAGSAAGSLTSRAILLRVVPVEGTPGEALVGPS